MDYAARNIASQAAGQQAGLRVVSFYFAFVACSSFRGVCSLGCGGTVCCSSCLVVPMCGLVCAIVCASGNRFFRNQATTDGGHELLEVRSGSPSGSLVCEPPPHSGHI